VLFDPSGEPTSINEEARRYLSRLPDGPSIPTHLGLRLQIWTVATALQARAIAQGRDRGGARVRIRTVDDRWLTCHASCLSGPAGQPGPVALVIEPAAAADLAALIAEGYGLTPREREITQLISRGLPTSEIAAALFMSPHTVRDHLKAVFGKTEVTSRGQLVARSSPNTAAQRLALTPDRTSALIEPPKRVAERIPPAVRGCALLCRPVAVPRWKSERSRSTVCL
jgi:DNA-binding CsgD family transcriptional regulator